MKKRPNRPIDRTRTLFNYNISLSPNALDTVERILEYCKAKGYISYNETNIEKIINDNTELTLVFEDLDVYDAYIQKIDNNNYKIAINNKHSKTRQRFSMAHEYIHYQMNRTEISNKPVGEQILHRSQEINNVEYLANLYAGAILMPEETFKQVAKEKNGDISEIAKEFNVSTLAVRYRAKSLGIGGHGL